MAVLSGASTQLGSGVVGGARIWTRDFALLLAGAFLQACAFYLLLPALPLFVTGVLRGSAGEVGLVFGGFSITAIVIRPFSGFLLDRYGRRVWQLLSSALFCVLMFAHALASSFELLMWCRLSQGLTWGMIGVASATIAADLAPASRRGTAMGIYGLAMPLALAVGPMAGALLVQDGDFLLLFVCCGVLSAAALVCFMLTTTPTVKSKTVRLSWENVYDFRVLRLFGFMVILCVAYGGWVSFVPLFALELSMSSSAPLFTVYAIAVLSTRFFGGRLYDRRGPRLPVVLGLGLLVVGWLSLGTCEAALFASVGAVFIGLGFGLIMPAFNAMAMDLVEAKRRGAANALVFSAYDLGISAGAFGLGLVSEAWGLRSIFLVSAVLTVLASVVFVSWTLPHFLRSRLALPD